ncbi:MULTISPECIES: hypothetical protein [unclassified Bifidobacterium]|uniref:phage tail tube protein n=1 Tax=unclassified Bifidobacterium TaxID=2608897 RepID=UPI0011289CAC|nr:MULTISPECIES: hypothetical protein [unclassified Bifidobacterium]TPF79461.1 hypothetical protein BW08_10020 [Bifidobacterium sp. UTCIF-24]TPF89162.1 hypothetical protein BW10_07310 [Bifidobacterium sp. UTBIF-56]
MGKPNAQMVSVGKPHGDGGRYAGGAWYGKVGEATPPTDATTTLTDKFHDLGYLSEDGVTNTIDRDSEDINAFGGDRVLSVTTSRAESFQFGMLETTPETLAVTYGPGNVEVKTVDGKDAITVKHNSAEPPELVYVFEFAMTGNRVKRIVVPVGKTGDVDDVTYADGEAITYTPTINAFPDANGNTAYEYIAYVTDADAPETTGDEPTALTDEETPTLAKAAVKAATRRKTTAKATAAKTA